MRALPTAKLLKVPPPSYLREPLGIVLRGLSAIAKKNGTARQLLPASHVAATVFPLVGDLGAALRSLQKNEKFIRVEKQLKDLDIRSTSSS